MLGREYRAPSNENVGIVASFVGVWEIIVLLSDKLKNVGSVINMWNVCDGLGPQSTPFDIHCKFIDFRNTLRNYVL